MGLIIIFIAVGKKNPPHSNLFGFLRESRENVLEHGNTSSVRVTLGRLLKAFFCCCCSVPCNSILVCVVCIRSLVKHMESEEFMQLEDLSGCVLRNFRGMLENPPELNEPVSVPFQRLSDNSDVEL